MKSSTRAAFSFSVFLCSTRTVNKLLAVFAKRRISVTIAHTFFLHIHTCVFKGFQNPSTEYKLHPAPFALNDSSNHVFFNHVEERCAITLLSDQVITVMLIFRTTV